MNESEYLGRRNAQRSATQSATVIRCAREHAQGFGLSKFEVKLHPKNHIKSTSPPTHRQHPHTPTHPSETAALGPYVIKAFMAKRMNGRRKETGSLSLSLFSDTSVLTHSSKTVVALFFIKGRKGK